jgi:hypothetical protein
MYNFAPDFEKLLKNDEVRNPKSEIRNPKSEIRVTKSEIAKKITKPHYK